MTFELTVLGSSSALPTSTKYPSAYVLNVHERFFLIDCGEGTQIQLRKAKMKFSKISHIFISHMHGDHVFGLFGLLSTFELLGRKMPLHIYGHPELNALITFYREHFGNEATYPIELHAISKRREQAVFHDKVVEVIAFPLKHRIPSFGYLFRETERPLNIRSDIIEKYRLNFKQINSVKSGEDLVLENGKIISNANLTYPPLKARTFAYCSDTAIYDRNLSILRNVDLLFHEATFLEKDKHIARLTGHSTALQAASFAVRAEIGELLIGHFSSRYKEPQLFLDEAQAVFKNTKIAGELERYSIPQKRIDE